MENLTNKIIELVKEVNIRKGELFKEYLNKTKEGFIKSDYDDFNEYEEDNTYNQVYKALDLSIDGIDDFFNNSYHNKFILAANKEKELSKMSEMERDILEIIPSIDKDKMGELIDYINGRIDEELEIF